MFSDTVAVSVSRHFEKIKFSRSSVAVPALENLKRLGGGLIVF